MKIGDCVVYGPDPRTWGFTLDKRRVGRVVKLYDNHGVHMAKVAFGMRTSSYPVEAWTVLEKEPKE